MLSWWMEKPVGCPELLGIILNWTKADDVFCLAVGLVYVVGGLNDMGLEMKMMESFNPVTQEWQSLCPMSERRAHVGIAALDNYIYVVGGWNEHEGALSSAERYSVEEVGWCLSLLDVCLCEYFMCVYLCMHGYNGQNK